MTAVGIKSGAPSFDKALDSSASRYLRVLTRGVVDAIVSVDESGCIIDWNPAAERLFGYAHDKAIGQPLEIIIPERYHEAHRSAMARLHRQGDAPQVPPMRELLARCRDGTEIPVELSISVWSDQGARFYTAIIRDVRHRKRAENELRHYAQRVEKQNLALQAKQRELRASRGALAQSIREAETLFAKMADVLEGRVLSGRYRLDRRLARGGFGVVYEATDLETGTGVAVKVLRPPGGSPSAEDIESFRREAALGLLIEHPNAVEIYALDIDESGLPYLVMELLSGESMCQRLLRKTPSLREILDWFRQIASALAAAHELGVIHRDISPSNLFLCRNSKARERLVVVDFGVAKLTRAASYITLTRPGEVLGTPQYLAPERLRGAPSSPAVDIYSLGVLVYELLAGRDPYPDSYVDGEHVFVRLTQSARPLDEGAPDLPAELCDLVDGMLAADPRHRPDAAQVFHILDAIGATISPRLFEQLRRPSTALVRGCSGETLSLRKGHE